MLTRKDGTIVTEFNLTDADVALTRFNILESLDTEEEIRDYLEGTIQDIETGECESSFFVVALSDVAKARAVNQLATETGIDRKVFCDMFLENPKAASRDTAISHDAIVKVAKAFATPVSV
jgi:probable addiction module antidote protein